MYTLDLQAAADFNIEIGGNSPGTTYDQANVTSTGEGGVTINDAVLNLTDLNGYTPQLGDQYVIIANAGTGAIAGDGTFVAGEGMNAVPANTVLTQGEIISNSFLGSGYEAVINYQGGPNGNSVVIDVLIPTYFANLNVPNSISYGTPSFTFTGTLAADSGHVPSGEDVAVTFNSITQNVPLNGNDQFQATFTTSGLQVSGSPYPVSFSYAGDLDFESSSANSTLTVYKASPYFSVSNYTIAAGTASTTVSGTLEANAYAQLVPSGETIAVTLERRHALPHAQRQRPVLHDLQHQLVDPCRLGLYHRLQLRGRCQLQFRLRHQQPERGARRAQLLDLDGDYLAPHGPTRRRHHRLPPNQGCLRERSYDRAGAVEHQVLSQQFDRRQGDLRRDLV